MTDENKTTAQVQAGEAWEQLMRLRDLTRRTGMLHELQMKQLKIWPRVFFDCDKHELTYDCDAKIVTITLVTKAALAFRDLERRIKALEDCIHTMLGPDWALLLWAKEGRKRLRPLYQGVRSPAPTDGVRLSEEDASSMVRNFRRYGAPRKGEFNDILDEELPPLLGK